MKCQVQPPILQFLRSGPSRANSGKHYSLDKSLNSDLSGRQRYPPFEQPRLTGSSPNQCYVINS